MRRGRRKRRHSNNETSVFPSMNSTRYREYDDPYPQYIGGVTAGYSYNRSFSGFPSLFSIFRSKSSDGYIIDCGIFRLKGKLGYLLLESIFGDVLIQIDYEGLYKYRFLEKSRYDVNEMGSLIILDEGFL